MAPPVILLSPLPKTGRKATVSLKPRPGRSGAAKSHASSFAEADTASYSA